MARATAPETIWGKAKKKNKKELFCQCLEAFFNGGIGAVHHVHFDVFDGVVGDDYTFINNNDARAHCFDLLHDVSREKDGFFFSKLSDKSTNFNELVRVET